MADVGGGGPVAAAEVVGALLQSGSAQLTEFSMPSTVVEGGCIAVYAREARLVLAKPLVLC